jgi:hypothetical protein
MLPNLQLDDIISLGYVVFGHVTSIVAMAYVEWLPKFKSFLNLILLLPFQCLWNIKPCPDRKAENKRERMKRLDEKLCIYL